LQLGRIYVLCLFTVHNNNNNIYVVRFWETIRHSTVTVMCRAGYIHHGIPTYIFYIYGNLTYHRARWNLFHQTVYLHLRGRYWLSFSRFLELIRKHDISVALARVVRFPLIYNERATSPGGYLNGLDVCKHREIITQRFAFAVDAKFGRTDIYYYFTLDARRRGSTSGSGGYVIIYDWSLLGRTIYNIAVYTHTCIPRAISGHIRI